MRGERVQFGAPARSGGAVGIRENLNPGISQDLQPPIEITAGTLDCLLAEFLLQRIHRHRPGSGRDYHAF